MGRDQKTMLYRYSVACCEILDEETKHVGYSVLYIRGGQQGPFLETSWYTPTDSHSIRLMM